MQFHNAGVYVHLHNVDYEWNTFHNIYLYYVFILLCVCVCVCVCLSGYGLCSLNDIISACPLSQIKKRNLIFTIYAEFRGKQ